VTSWTNSFTAESAIDSTGSSGQNVHHCTASRIVAATGTYTTTPSFTSIGATGYSGIISTWKIAASGVGAAIQIIAPILALQHIQASLR
jgi:hypothetical protein